MKAIKIQGEDGRGRHPPPKARYKRTQGKGENSEEADAPSDLEGWGCATVACPVGGEGQIPTLELSSWFRGISVGNTSRTRATESPRHHSPPTGSTSRDTSFARQTRGLEPPYSSSSCATTAILSSPPRPDHPARRARADEMTRIPASPPLACSAQTLQQGPTRRRELSFAPRTLARRSLASCAAAPPHVRSLSLHHGYHSTHEVVHPCAPAPPPAARNTVGEGWGIESVPAGQDGDGCPASASACVDAPRPTQLCAIEPALRMHPDSELRILALVPGRSCTEPRANSSVCQ
ncbi:hypothetical protein DFH09DRAFT_1317139 [Mycena vulgaris]|nr:hypothetical protein DFH09DRAFT_1317139 [Mycena vulgaris]